MKSSITNLLKSLMVIFFVLGCDNKAKKQVGGPPKGGKPPAVTVQVMQPEALANEIEFGGTVSPYEFVEIRPEISGRVVFLNTQVEGQTVPTSTVLAKLNATEYEAQLKRAMAQQEFTAKAKLRAQKLIESQSITQQELDAAIQNHETATADVQYYQAMIEKTIIKAPFAGVVGLRAISNGAYVTPATIITTLQQTNPVKIDFTVPERYLTYISTGQTFKISFDSKQYSAKIIAIDTRLENNSRNLRVRSVLQQQIALPVGAYVRVLITPESQASFWLPTAAILPDAKNKQVIRINHGRAEMLTIETGIRTKDRIEVIQGIQRGDSIVVSGMMFVRPNKPVLVNQVR